MAGIPTNDFVEWCGTGYCLAGTGISLDSIGYPMKWGEGVEEILGDFHALHWRELPEDAMAFVHAHQEEDDANLAEGALRCEETRKLNPPELVRKVRRYRAERGLKSA